VRFAIGVAFDYTSAHIARERERLAAKRRTSANFVMAQPAFTVAQAEQLLRAVDGVWDRPVMPGIWPLQSREQAVRLNETLPGVTVPEEVIAAMPSRTEGAERCEQVGRELARTLIHRLRDEHLFAGAYIIAPNRDPWRALKMLNGE
jgi:5,10-methylenetetrahydrofolate reductase